MKRGYFKISGVVATILSFFILDRILKELFLAKPQLFFRLFFLKFVFYQNEKILFGLLDFNFLVIIFSFLVLACLIVYIFSSFQKKDQWSFSAGLMISAGAFSNLIDRMFYGFVVDYLVWPLNFFNLADVMILAGVIIFLFKTKIRKDRLIK